MDRIEQLMKDAKPHVAEPATTALPAGRPLAVSDDPDMVVRLAGHRSARRTVIRTAAAALAAAAVVGAVVVAGGMRGPQVVPAPPAATTEAAPTPSATASTPAPAVLSTGGVPCTVANISQPMNTPAAAIGPIPDAEQEYYMVLGCADGWLAYSISDDGARDLQLDGGNAWFRIARLQESRFVFDVQQPWSTVFTWKFQALNNDVAQNGQVVTPQQAMDREFAEKGIPVELRPQLVGAGPGAADLGGTTYEQTSQGHVVSFQHPAAFTPVPSADNQQDGGLDVGVEDTFGTRTASLRFGAQAEDFEISCGPGGEFEVIESASVAGLPDPSARMVFGVFTGGQLHGALLIARVNGAGTDACALTAVQADGLKVTFDTGLRQPVGAGALDLRFDTVDVARGWTATEEYNQIATVLATLSVTPRQR